MKKLFLLFTILILLALAGASCSRRGYSGFRTNNRLISRPHKSWKQPKSRYPRREKSKLVLYEKTFALSVTDTRY